MPLMTIRIFSILGQTKGGESMSMREAELLIRADKLSFAYPSADSPSMIGEPIAESSAALSEIDFQISPGEFVAVLGANGSGKSTLARHLNALLLPDSGTVWVCGLDTRDAELHWQIRQQVGMVFQNPDNQIVATVVEEDVAFGPENLGLSTEEIHCRVDDALQRVDMQEYRLRAPHLLSGGQKQRVAIAGIIAMRPRLVVLDEATAMLDPAGRRDVRRAIEDLRCQGIAIILITHHMEEALSADRVVLLEAGRVAAEGAPRQIFVQTELLRRLRLDVPVVVDIAGRLHRDGLLERADVLSAEEMVALLCP